MLTRLKIKNFQKHETFRIKFDPHVTAIIGDSDTGKSALIRAIRWLVMNRPSGDSFIREGQKECSSKIQVDGKTIERKKNGKENTYRLDKTIFRSFGTDVPAPISQLLRLSEINFQGQHDPPFWFNLTAGEVAKQLNEIVDLKLIDEVSTKLAQQLRKNRTEISVIEDRLKNSEIEADRLEWTEEASGDLVHLIEVRKQYAEKRRLVDHMNDLVKDGVVHQERVGVLSKARVEASDVYGMGVRWHGILSKLLLLEGWIIKGRDCQKLIDMPIPNLGGLKELSVKIHKVLGEVNSIRFLVKEGVRYQSSMGKKSQLLEEAEKRLRKLSEGKCPLCGRGDKS